MGFSSPGLLPLAALASIPLVIHILSRLRLQRQPFPSLLLLRTVRRERFSWLRLKEIILLALRTLALLALLLALSRPYLARALPGLTRAGDLVLVIDDSYSMAHGDRWGKAVSRARQILRSIGPGQRLAFLTASGLEIAGSAGARNQALGLLDTLNLAALAPDLGRALGRSTHLAESLRASVTVITDLQERAIPAGWRKPPGIDVVLEDVADPAPDNAGITRLYPENVFVRAGRANRIMVEVANYGARKTTRRLALSLGARHDEKVCELAGHARRTVAFDADVSGPGRYALTAEITPDSLGVDDRRFLALPVSDVVPVLVVESERVTGRYVNQALAADSGAGFSTRVIPASGLGRENLSRYRTVIVTDPAAFRAGDWNRLGFYLGSGGTCLLMAGLVPPGPASLGGYVRSNGTGQTAGFLSISTADTTHPVFSRLNREALAAIRVWQHSRLQAGGSRVLAGLTDGSPLVLEHPDHRLLIWSIGPTPEFSDIVYKASFVPLLYETIGYLCATGSRAEYTAGDTIRLPLERAGPVVLTTPRGRIRIEPVLEQNRAVLVLTDTKTPGVYSVETESGSPIQRQEPAVQLSLAVNPLPEEGDLARARPERLAQQGFRVRSVESRGTADLSLPLLYLAALAFLSEMLLLVLERRPAS